MNIWKKIVAIGVLGILLYGGIYTYALQSEGFKFVESALLNSRVIQKKVGGVQKVTLSLFGTFKEKDVNSDKIVTVSAKVVGEIKTVIVNVKAIRKDGDWKIEAASINGVSITLD